MAFRLASFYFLLFAYLGVFVPWLPPLLDRRGFSAWQIGLALAAVQVSRTLLPPAWGLIADRLRQRRLLLGCAALAAGACLVALVPPLPAAGVIALLALHGLFLVPLFPLAETLTLEALGPRRQRYGRIRLWGSVGFIATSLGLGVAVEYGGLGDSAAVWAMALPLMAAGVLALMLGGRESQRAHAVPHRGADGLGARRLWPLLVLIAAAALGQGAHGPYYVFFTIQLEKGGVARDTIGLLWGWGVLSEVLIMAFSHRIVARWGLMSTFRAALTLAVLRWSILATAPALPVVAATQTLHAATFALLHVSVIQLADVYAPPRRRVFAQSLVSAGAYGLGIGSGNFLAGRFVDHVGFEGLYVGAAIACVAALALSTLLGERGRR